MPRGGARQGAGRPKGSKDSKPRKITVRTLDDVKRVKARAMNEGKILPLDLFMDVLNDPEADHAARMEAAKAAAPYMHPRLQATVFQDQTDKMTHEQRLAELDALGDPPKTINHATQGGSRIKEPAPAVVAVPVPHETRPIHRANGNGANTTQPQRVNGHPRRVNGAVVRRSDDEIRNLSDRRRALSD